MVARAGGYNREEFKGARGVTQGYQLSPTIFNLVVDVVVCYWVTMSLDEAEKRVRGGTRVGTKLPYSKRTTAWWRHPTPAGYSRRLTHY